MKIWERRMFGIAALGGGYVGLAAGVPLLASEISIFAKLFVLPFLSLYLWGTWCGLRMIEIGERALRMNRRFWLLQVPFFMTPWLGYIFGSGVLGWIALKQPLNLEANVRFGSQFEYSILEGKPWMLGINLVALAAWLWLGKRMRQSQVAMTSNPDTSCRDDRGGLINDTVNS